MKTYSKFLLKGLMAALILTLLYSCSTSEDETTLIITVRDYNTQQVIQGAAVALYKTNGDYTYSSNPYKDTNTDASGQATFIGIDSGIDYYFGATQGGKNNFTFGSTHNLGYTINPRQTAQVSTTIR